MGKIIFVILLLCIGALIALYPPVYREKVCYDKTQLVINEINVNVPSRGWGKQQVCEVRTNTLMELEDCIHQATASSKVAVYANDVISDAVFFIRPLTTSLSRLKAEHNEDCSEYQKYQME